MGRPLGLSVLSVLLALFSVIFSYLGFFSSTWIQVFSDDEQTQISAENNNLEKKNTLLNQRERLSTTQSGKYGLFDHGVSDMNCDAIPFSICMYTRAGLFTAIILQIPSLVVAILSCAIMTSGGSLRTTDKIENGHYFLVSKFEITDVFFSNYKHFFSIFVYWNPSSRRRHFLPLSNMRWPDGHDRFHHATSFLYHQLSIRRVHLLPANGRQAGPVRLEFLHFMGRPNFGFYRNDVVVFHRLDHFEIGCG